MDYEEFYSASKNLKEFFHEQNKLNTVIKILVPNSEIFCEFGNKFIDDYIKLVELALKDDSNWFSWFVFDNEFGQNELEIIVNGTKYRICNEKQFFEMYLKNKKADYMVLQ